MSRTVNQTRTEVEVADLRCMLWIKSIRFVDGLNTGNQDGS